MLVVLGDVVPALFRDAQVSVGVRKAGQDAGQHIAHGAAAQTGKELVLAVELGLCPQIQPILGSFLRRGLVLIVYQQDRLLDDGVVISIRVIQTLGDLIRPIRHKGHQDILGFQVLPDDRIQAIDHVCNGGSCLSDQTVLGVTCTSIHKLNGKPSLAARSVSHSPRPSEPELV